MPWLTGVSAGVLLLVSVLINTRLGMSSRRRRPIGSSDTWEMIRDDLLPGLFRWIIWLSRRVQSTSSRSMYTVDEWLRFRTGESRLSFVRETYPGPGVVVITYVVRFVVNLLIEPQINPIKHFPVVTVSHKLAAAARPDRDHVRQPILGPLEGPKTEFAGVASRWSASPASSASWRGN